MINRLWNFLPLFFWMPLIQPGAVVLGQNPKELTNSIGMKLTLIPSGRFLMGSASDEPRRNEDEQQHEVTITRSFYLGVFEVTQAQYQAVMGDNPSHFQGAIVSGPSNELPVDQVSFEQALEFCNRLSQLPQEKQHKRTYRLPTEAEWEYASRAGSSTAYCFDDEPGLLFEYGWFRDNSSMRPHSVGLKEPNAWGLYDMHGNVWEWCADGYREFSKEPVRDPFAKTRMGKRYMCRGGSWNDHAAYSRSAHRAPQKLSAGAENNGFRVALTILVAD